MKYSTVFIVLLPLVMTGTNCDRLPGPPDGTTNTARVVLQITESQDPEAFDKIMTELRARNITATVMVTGDFCSENCQAIADARDEGHEIMAFLRPMSPTGEKLTLSVLSRAEQEQAITETKTALETCLGTTITGFRATNFDQNQDTYEILSTLDFEYNLAFVAGESYLPGHETDVLPYRSTEYGFWAVPMHAADRNGEPTAFCDNPFASLSAEDWEALLKSEFDRMRAEGRPLLVEFHPYRTGVDEGRFQAFVTLLDYAVQEGAEFLTATEYVEWCLLQDSSCSE